MWVVSNPHEPQPHRTGVGAVVINRPYGWRVNFVICSSDEVGDIVGYGYVWILADAMLSRNRTKVVVDVLQAPLYQIKSTVVHKILYQF
jgi:hypothetical protein